MEKQTKEIKVNGRKITVVLKSNNIYGFRYEYDKEPDINTWDNNEHQIANSIEQAERLVRVHLENKA